MFKFLKKPTQEEIQAELEEEKERVRQERIRQAEAKKREQEIARVIEENRNTSFVIDWDKLNPFSVERTYNNDHWSTVIGYFLNGNVKEWYLHCSLEVHMKLTEEFKQYIEKKKQ